MTTDDQPQPTRPVDQLGAALSRVAAQAVTAGGAAAARAKATTEEWKALNALVPFDRWQEAQQLAGPYFHKDGVLNEAGQRFVAESVADAHAKARLATRGAYKAAAVQVAVGAVIAAVVLLVSGAPLGPALGWGVWTLLCVGNAVRKVGNARTHRDDQLHYLDRRLEWAARWVVMPEADRQKIRVGGRVGLAAAAARWALGQVAGDVVNG